MRTRGLRATILAALSLLLSSCAVLDNYSTRAIDYNIEAEDAGNQALLLNIVRASLHRPMQFTDVQTILGSTTAAGSLGFNFPLGPMSGVMPTMGTTGSSLAGGTTFTIPVLNTQEFYQGILRPFPSESIDYFLKGPNARNLTMNLLFERITVKVDSPACANSHLETCERDFRNAPMIGSDLDLALFQSFVNFLLSMQFSTERYEAAKAKEPEKKGVTTVINVPSPGAASDDAKPSYRVCFSNRMASPYIETAEQCGSLKKPVDPKDPAQHTAIRFAPRLAQEMRDAIDRVESEGRGGEEWLLNSYRHSIKAFTGARVLLTLQPRSTYDVFRYLGGLVERSRTIPIPREMILGGGTIDMPYLPCWLDPRRECKPILVIDSPGQPVGALTFVAYAGTSFSIPGDPQQTYGPDVLAMLKELIALNTSSKSLPTTAVLSLATAR